MEDNKVLQDILTIVTQLQHDTKEGFKKVNHRLDLQGKQLSYLDDDAPTREEFDQLEQRVVSVENKLSS